MTEGDAKEYLTEKDPTWEMPEEWWQIETMDLSLHVTEDVALGLLGLTDEPWRVCSATNGDYFEFEDIYGATIYLPKEPKPMIFKTNRLCRAKWIVGLPERNWKPDEKPDWEG